MNLEMHSEMVIERVGRFTRRLCMSKMYFMDWKAPGVSEIMWRVNLDASISGEY